MYEVQKRTTTHTSLVRELEEIEGLEDVGEKVCRLESV
jgi:hypothetical protein